MEKKKVFLRKCNVCGCHNGAFLHRMDFAVFDGFIVPSSYDLVCCERCGFIFADVDAPQSTYDSYYLETTNFDTTSGTSSNDDWLNVICTDIYGFIGKDDSVLDVGCGSGGVLRSLKNNGYVDLEGFEISGEIKTTLAKYDIPVIVGNFFEHDFRGKKYDAVIATEIFEHIKELGGFIGKLKNVLKAGGVLFVTVPDASRYHQVNGKPFFSVSTEHVNHFDMCSLKNLLELNGFTCEYMERRNQSYQGTDYPQILAVFKNEALDEYDIVGADYFGEFISFIRESQKCLEKEVLKGYAESGEPVAVWGVGVYAQNLLSNTTLKDCNIRAFIDNNEKKHGKTLNGINVYPASYLYDFDGDILITLLTYYKDIEKQIRGMGLDNKVVLL